VKSPSKIIKDKDFEMCRKLAWERANPKTAYTSGNVYGDTDSRETQNFFNNFIGTLNEFAWCCYFLTEIFMADDSRRGDGGGMDLMAGPYGMATRGTVWSGPINLLKHMKPAESDRGDTLPRAYPEDVDMISLGHVVPDKNFKFDEKYEKNFLRAPGCDSCRVILRAWMWAGEWEVYARINGVKPFTGLSHYVDLKQMRQDVVELKEMAMPEAKLL
jgi:hypothetical protein|tara:strand:+ start:305 stop:952 length:648 start_codon:yes stop_codon:yes gene_type:complete